jgi:hypothetical protein
MAKRRVSRAARKDELSGRKNELRAARIEGDEPGGSVEDDGAIPSDDAQVASESMVLERLPHGRAPRGRQRTGDPPAV